jgi:LysR family glycine cleavage system transcriptional activator
MIICNIYPMSLPSIPTLRAFEAAGRLHSYSKAADELGLTHSAVSHRIRELELYVDAQLFRRSGNRMIPTLAAHEMLVRVRHALRILERTFEKSPAVQAPGMESALTVSVLPVFAAKWLIPRLSNFYRLYPDFELMLQASDSLAEFQGRDIDAAIRFGPGEWPGVQGMRLHGETLSPVCSPAYCARHALNSVSDLEKCELLRHSWQSWSPWFEAAGLDFPEPILGPSFDDTSLLIEAAACGMGVALARGLLVADDLRTGRLVRPFPIEVNDAYSYHLVWKTPARAPMALDAFRQWLINELASDT